MTASTGSHGASYERVVSAVTAAGGDVRPHSGYVMTTCPVHDDRKPSVSITYLPQQSKTRVKCFACGDDNTAILDAWNLTVADLYDEPRSDSSRDSKPAKKAPKRAPQRTTKPLQAKKSDAKPTTKLGPLVASYEYRRLDGSKAGLVQRYDELDVESGERIGKSFRQKRFDVDSRRWKPGGFEPLLYRLPQVASAVEAGSVVYLVEGEKDADSLIGLGATATCNAGGASAFSAEHAEQLRGAHVVLLVDRDLAGYRRALTAGQLLDGVAATFSVWAPVAGKDITDHIQAGHALDEVVAVDDVAGEVARGEMELAAEQADDPDRQHMAAATLKRAEDLVESVSDENRQMIADAIDQVRAVLPPDEVGEDELAARRRERVHVVDGEDDDGDGPAVVPNPHWAIPASSGSWAYSTGEDGDGIPRGVYRHSNKVWEQAGPLPYVLERLTRRDGQGRRVGVSYRLAMKPLAEATDVVICGDDEIKDGSWAEQLDVVLAADDKIIKMVATAIRHTAREHAPVREITPGWSSEGELLMPPTDVLGGGYGEKLVDEATARAAWRGVAEVARSSPKVALALGAAMGGLFVKPLLAPQRSFFLELVGRGQHGKTTTLKLAASLFGDPDTVIETMDSSGKGLSYRLGELACMPIFLDEIGAGEMANPINREKLILSVAESARRRTATRTQGSRISAPWHGTVIMTGNDSLTEGIANEAVFARVLEVPAPITASVEDSDSLQGLLTVGAYGWPLEWVRQSLELDRMREFIGDAEEALPIPGGGVPKTIGHNLCLAIAGAAELDRVFGTDVLRAAALESAQTVLAALVDELEERGKTPAERILMAVTQALTARPTAFPTRAMYRAALGESTDGGYFPAMAREIEGFVLGDDDDYDGDIAVLHDKLPAIAAASGVNQPRPGLRELAKQGVLVPSGESEGKLQKRIRTVGKARASCYIFRLDPEVFDELNRGHGPTGDTPEDSPHEPVNRTDDDPSADPSPSPVSPAVPDSHKQTGDSSIPAMTRTDEPLDAATEEAVPGVPGSDDNVAREGEVVVREEGDEPLGAGHHGHDMWVTNSAGRRTGVCRACGEDSRHYDDQGWLHWSCASALPSPTGDNAEKAPTRTDVASPLEEATAAPSPAVESVPDSHETTGDTASEALTRTDDVRNDSADGPVPDVPGSDDNVARTKQKAEGEEEEAAREAQLQTGRVELTGPVPPAPKGYRASCMVIDPTGIYLPDGTHITGATIGDALDALDLADRGRIGHPGGPGQLIFTDAMCAELGLIAEPDPDVAGDDARKQVSTRLAGFDGSFLGRAREAGWDLASLRVETRARRGERVLDIVLAPYEHLWTRGRDEVHPLGALDPAEQLDQAGYAAQAARLMGYLAHLLGAPWRSSAVQVGWDLFDRSQRGRSRRKGHVLTQPARLPALTGDVDADGLVPTLTWSRWTKSSPASDRERELLSQLRYAVHLDRKAAWLASGSQAVIGYITDDEPQMYHHHGQDAVRALLERPESIPAGLYRLRLPAAEHSEMPPLHPLQSRTRPRWVWMPAPLVASALYDDDPNVNWIGLGCSVDELTTPAEGDSEGRVAEAWTFPAQGRLLDGLWYETLRDARYTLDKDGDETATQLIKHVYSGMLQTTQNTPQHVLEGKRAWHHQATLLATVKAHHYGWQYSLLRRAHYRGAVIASAQIDEVVMLVTDVDQASLGRMTGHIGQYKSRPWVRELTDEHREQLASGVPAHELKGGETTL